MWSGIWDWSQVANRIIKFDWLLRLGQSQSLTSTRLSWTFEPGLNGRRPPETGDQRDFYNVLGFWQSRIANKGINYWCLNFLLIYLFKFSKKKIKYRIFKLLICYFIQSKLHAIEFCKTSTKYEFSVNYIVSQGTTNVSVLPKYVYKSFAAEQNGQAVQPPAPSDKNGSDMDTQLADFLAVCVLLLVYW